MPILIVLQLLTTQIVNVQCQPGLTMAKSNCPCVISYVMSEQLKELLYYFQFHFYQCKKVIFHRRKLPHVIYCSILKHFYLFFDIIVTSKIEILLISSVERCRNNRLPGRATSWRGHGRPLSAIKEL